MARANEKSHSFTCHPHVYPQVEQSNRRLHFALTMHSRHPISADVAYRQHAGGGPSHGYGQHAQKI